jgi:hypothetical protein
MADSVACLSNGKVLLIQAGLEPAKLESPYAERVSPARFVGVTRGRVSAELCYAVSAGAVSAVFAQKPGTREEHRLFHSTGVQLAEIDFSFADEAFTCTVDGKEGTSAIGVLADDGKGVRTVTEGDVLDRGPRWVPGGTGEIVYASAGIGRTRSGAWAGRAPFSLHRLRMNDGTVEVLVSDAKYDYVAPVAVSAALIYAIRRRYEEAKSKTSILGALSALLGARRNGRQKAADPSHLLIWGNWVELPQHAEDAARAPETAREPAGYELVRITPTNTEAIARGVLAFDVAPNGDIVYSNGRALYRAAPDKKHERELIANVQRAEQILIC